MSSSDSSSHHRRKKRHHRRHHKSSRSSSRSHGIDDQLQSLVDSIRGEMTANNELLFNKLGKISYRVAAIKGQGVPSTGQEQSIPLSHPRPWSRVSLLFLPWESRVSQTPRGRVPSIIEIERTVQSLPTRSVAVRRLLPSGRTPETGVIERWMKP